MPPEILHPQRPDLHDVSSAVSASGPARAASAPLAAAPATDSICSATSSASTDSASSIRDLLSVKPQNSIVAIQAAAAAARVTTAVPVPSEANNTSTAIKTAPVTELLSNAPAPPAAAAAAGTTSEKRHKSRQCEAATAVEQQRATKNYLNAMNVLTRTCATDHTSLPGAGSKCWLSLLAFNASGDYDEAHLPYQDAVYSQFSKFHGVEYWVEGLVTKVRVYALCISCTCCALQTSYILTPLPTLSCKRLRRSSWR